MPRILMSIMITHFGGSIHFLPDHLRHLKSPHLATNELLGHSLLHTPPYHPLENSVLEQSHRTVGMLFWASLAETGDRHWADTFPSIQLTLNSAPCQGTPELPLLHVCCTTCPPIPDPPTGGQSPNTAMGSLSLDPHPS